MNICKNNCSHDSNKIVELLQTVKSLYNRLSKDIFQYAQELEKFQDYYQRFDLNNDTMLKVMKSKLNKLSILFFKAISNHLSVTTNVRGIGEKIIKPIKQEYGTSTTIKYQNICKGCIGGCNGGSNKFSNIRDKLKVQTTINIASYDNISIEKVLENDMLMGYMLIVGKLSYHINNFSEITDLKQTVRVTNNFSGENPYEEQEKISTQSIELLYEFIDNQIATLADIETILVVNIEYITKCINKFNSGF